MTSTVVVSNVVDASRSSTRARVRMPVDFGEQPVLDGDRIGPEQRDLEAHDEHARRPDGGRRSPDPAPTPPSRRDLPEHLETGTAGPVDDGEQRDADGDAQARERPEEHDGEGADRGRHEVGPADRAYRRMAGHVHETPDRGDDDRAEHRSGQVREEPGEAQEHDDDQDGRDQPGDLARRTGGPAVAVFDRLPATAMPLERPAAMFDAPTPMSSRSVSTR